MQQGGVLEARASTEAVPDRELLRAVRAGDIDVFDVLWNRYHGQLLGYAVKRLPIQQAEDAISIVMEGTLRALIAGKGPEQFFRAYVFQSLRREIGRQRADAELNQPAEHEQLDLVAPVRHEPQRLEVGMLVKDILGSFSQSDRLLLTLNLEEGRRIADIATSLGLAPESASQRLYRAKSEFKSRWFAAHLDLSDAPELCRTTLADAPYAMGRRHKPGRAKKFWSHVDSCDFCRPRVQEAEGAADRLVVLFPAAFAAFAWAEPGALVVQALQATGRSLNPSGMAGIANSVSAVPIGAKVGAGAAVVAMGVGVSLLMSGVLAPAHQADNLTAKVPSQDRATSLTAPATPPQTSASRLQPPATTPSSAAPVTSAPAAPLVPVVPSPRPVTSAPVDGGGEPQSASAPSARPTQPATPSHSSPAAQPPTAAPTSAPTTATTPAPTTATAPASPTGRKPCSWAGGVACFSK